MLTDLNSISGITEGSKYPNQSMYSRVFGKRNVIKVKRLLVKIVHDHAIIFASPVLESLSYTMLLSFSSLLPIPFTDRARGGNWEIWFFIIFVVH